MILGIAVMRPFYRCLREMHRLWTMVCVIRELYILFATALSWQLVLFEKTFQAVGRMVESMTCMMSGAIINIILDPVLDLRTLDHFRRWESKEPHLQQESDRQQEQYCTLIFYIVNPLPVKYRKKYLKADLKLWKNYM